jgi:hypothetical protein
MTPAVFHAATADSRGKPRVSADRRSVALLRQNGFFRVLSRVGLLMRIPTASKLRLVRKLFKRSVPWPVDLLANGGTPRP